MVREGGGGVSNIIGFPHQDQGPVINKEHQKILRGFYGLSHQEMYEAGKSLAFAAASMACAIQQEDSDEAHLDFAMKYLSAAVLVAKEEAKHDHKPT